ncbi:hypothetical protein EON65_33165 [archaeon]|nr:MAG: hypothetical protein EON65_33165 [archaeon]
MAGQALSHCVNYSVRDLVLHWAPRSCHDIALLIDGMIMCIVSLFTVYGFGAVDCSVGTHR